MLAISSVPVPVSFALLFAASLPRSTMNVPFSPMSSTELFIQLIAVFWRTAPSSTRSVPKMLCGDVAEDVSTVSVPAPFLTSVAREDAMLSCPRIAALSLRTSVAVAASPTRSAPGKAALTVTALVPVTFSVQLAPEAASMSSVASVFLSSSVPLPPIVPASVSAAPSMRSVPSAVIVLPAAKSAFCQTSVPAETFRLSPLSAL